MLIFNEIMVSTYLYLTLCLTDFMLEHPFREQIGFLLLYMVSFTVVVNFLKACYSFPWAWCAWKMRTACSRVKKYALEDEVPCTDPGKMGLQTEEIRYQEQELYIDLVRSTESLRKYREKEKMKLQQPVRFDEQPTNKNMKDSALHLDGSQSDFCYRLDELENEQVKPS
jgi:hypothetical protein